MSAKTMSTRPMHKYVVGLVAIWLLFIASFPLAYLRVSKSGKYGGNAFKSLTWAESQRPKQ